jgi:biopolymer transport protein ExbD
MKVDLEQGEEIGVQMAPLIDCVFLLLIFFLVTSTMKKVEPELPLDLPSIYTKLQSRQPVTPDMVVISIDSEGNFYLAGQQAGQGFVIQELDRLKDQDPTTRIRIDADRNAPAWALVQAIEECNFRGLKNVGIRAHNPGWEAPVPPEAR